MVTARYDHTPLHLCSCDIAAAIERVNVGVAARDPDGVLIYVNERLTEWLGYTRDELIGRHIHLLVPPEVRDLLQVEMDAARTGDVRARLSVMQRKDSTTFPAITLPHPIINDDGEYEGNIVIIVDLGTVQTAKPIGSGKQDLHATLSRISLELQSLSLSAELPSLVQLPLRHPQLRDLSPRETEVLTQLMASFRVPAIATKLHISQHTVRNHLKSIYRKVGVQGQSELIEWVHSLDE